MTESPQPEPRVIVWPNGRLDVIDAPLEEAMRVADQMITEWKTTLDWLAQR